MKLRITVGILGEDGKVSRHVVGVVESAEVTPGKRLLPALDASAKAFELTYELLGHKIERTIIAADRTKN